MGEEHWTLQLFLNHPDLFLPIHEAGLPYAADQVTRLEQILQKTRVRADISWMPHAESAAMRSTSRSVVGG